MERISASRWAMLVVLGSVVPVRAVRAASGDDSYSPPIRSASGEAELAMKRFHLAEGLDVSLFAAEPLLANPVCLYVDAHGRVYVAETFRHSAGVTDIRNHMSWLDDDLASKTVADRVAMIHKFEGANARSYATEHERIRLIEDRDGDGHADRATVFADQFNAIPDGIGAGLLVDHGDVYYACIPSLWKLRDTDEDGRADHEKVLQTGYGVHVSLLGHDLHGLRIGPDGRLYFSIGDRGLHVETEHGTIAYPQGGAVLRCDLDGSNLEIFYSGLRNPQELVFDEHGNLFTGDNNSDSGDRARFVYLVEGGDSGWRGAFQWMEGSYRRGPWNLEELWYPPFPGQAGYLLPPVANIADGPSGLTYYPGTGLSERYLHHFFLCDFRAEASISGVHSFAVEPK